MDTWFFEKAAKYVLGKKEGIFNKCWINTISACRIIRFILITLHRIQAQVSQGPQHKSSCSKSKRREVYLEHIGKRENILNRSPIAQALRSRILLLQQRMLSVEQNVSLQNGRKTFISPTSDRGLIFKNI